MSGNLTSSALVYAYPRLDTLLIRCSSGYLSLLSTWLQSKIAAQTILVRNSVLSYTQVCNCNHENQIAWKEMERIHLCIKQGWHDVQAPSLFKYMEQQLFKTMDTEIKFRSLDMRQLELDSRRHTRSTLRVTCVKYKLEALN